MLNYSLSNRLSRYVMDSVEWGRGEGRLSLLNDIDKKSVALLEQLETFAGLAAKYGYKVTPYSQTSLRLLPLMSDDQKDQMREFYKLWSQWITVEASDTEVEVDTPADSETEPLHVSLEKEKYFLKKALTHFGMWAHDDFLDSLKEGQLIEVYNDQMRQVYRNLNFFKYCSYSLFDVSFYQWYDLWQRPSRIQEQMLAHAEKILQMPISIMPYSVTPHILRESRPNELEDGTLPMACLVEFLNIGSLFRGLEKAPVGGIATSVGEIVAVGPEALSIQFI